MPIANHNMSHKKSTKPVQLPKVPVGNKQQKNVQDAFWSHQGTSGAINAFRQLTNSVHKGGRKQSLLPGAKLQPLFKNYTAPSRLEGGNLNSSKTVLPGITNPGGFPEGDASFIDHVIQGNTSPLPKPTASCVRIYLASNYKDMQAERLMLMREAVPQLETFCSNEGLLFQLVDLNWAMRGNLTSSPDNCDLRRREIADCQRLSLGCNFVVLLGDSYGEQNLLPYMREDEYNLLTSLANDSNIEHKDLLNKHYWRDENAVPLVYVLQFPDTAEEGCKLGTLIDELVKLAVTKGMLSEDTTLAFSPSGLAQDVQAGIFDSQNPRSCCLGYHREFRHLAQHVKTPHASVYLDMLDTPNNNTPVDYTRQRKLRDLEAQLMQHLGVGNFRQYFLQWDEENGCDWQRPEDDFQRYLDKLCVDFVNDVKHLIRQGLERKANAATGVVEDAISQEVLYHAQKFTEVNTNPQGHSQKMKHLEAFLRNPKENSKPYLVIGDSGSGKSVMMAVVADKLREWFQGSCIVVFRSLGITSQSSSILELVRSITLQICMAYKLKLPSHITEFCSLFEALSTFRMVLNVVSKEHAFVKPLFILLDGLGRLQPHEESLKALWAMEDLPNNVHIIVSTVPQIGDVNLAGALLNLVTDEEASTQVPHLNEEEVQTIVDRFLSVNNRKLMEHQTAYLFRCISESSSPLDLQVLLQMAKRIRSWEVYSKDSAPQSMGTVLNSQLDMMEQRFGMNVVMFFAAYITAVPLGLHERSLVDLLTNNGDVMEEVKKLHCQEDHEVSVFPPRLLAQLKYHLSDFITENFMFKQRVLAWSNHKIYFIMAKKYMVIFPGMWDDGVSEEATSFSLMLHEHMANMYLGETGSDSQSTSESEPVMSSQALVKQNLMKFHQLPKHMKVLLPVEGIERVKQLMLMNYQWLTAKLDCMSPWDVMLDHFTLLTLARQMRAEGVLHNSVPLTDLHLLFEFFQLAAGAIVQNSNNFVFELWGRLSAIAEHHSSIRQLLDEAAESVCGSEQHLLLPVFPFLRAPGGVLRHALPGCTHVVSFLQDGELAVTFSQKIGCGVVRVDTGELQQRFPVNKEQVLTGVIPGHTAQFVIIAHFSYINSIMTVSVWSTETGVKLVQSQFPHKFDAIALDPTDNTLVVSTTVDTLENNVPATMKCILGVDIHTKEILYSIPTNQGHQDGVTCILFVSLPGDSNNSDECLLTLGTSPSNEVVLWSVENESVLQKLELPDSSPDILKYNSDTGLVLAGNTNQGVLYVFDILVFQINLTIKTESLKKMLHVVLASGQILVATQLHGVQAFSLDDGHLLQEYRLPQGPHVPSVVCTSDENHILIAGYTCGDIVLFSMTSGEVVTQLLGHSKQVNTLHLMDGYKLMSAGDDEQAIVWHVDIYLQHSPADNREKSLSELQTEGGLQPVERQHKDISCCLLSADGSELFTCSPSGPIRVLHIETGNEKKTISSGIEIGLSAMYFAYRGKLLVGHGIVAQTPSTHSLKVWNALSGEELHFEGAGDILVYCSCVFPNNEDRLLTVSPANDYSGMVVSVYDLYEMQLVTFMHCNISGSMDSTSLSLRGFTAYTNPESAAISTITETQAPPQTPSTIPVPTETSPRIDKTNNSQEGLMKRLHKLYAVLDYCPEPGVSFFFSLIVSGAGLNQLSMEHHEPVHLDTLSPQCTQVMPNGCCITGTTLGQIIAWDVAAQKIMTYLYDRSLAGGARSGQGRGRAAHMGAVSCLLISHDEKLLVSGANDLSVKIWSLQERVLLHTLTSHSDKILSLALSSDSRILATGSCDKSLRLWRTLDGACLRTAFMHFPVQKQILSMKHQRLVAVLDQKCPQLAILKMINFEGQGKVEQK